MNIKVTFDGCCPGGNHYIFTIDDGINRPYKIVKDKQDLNKDTSDFEEVSKRLDESITYIVKNDSSGDMETLKTKINNLEIKV